MVENSEHTAAVSFKQIVELTLITQSILSDMENKMELNIGLLEIHGVQTGVIRVTSKLRDLKTTSVESSAGHHTLMSDLNQIANKRRKLLKCQLIIYIHY